MAVVPGSGAVIRPVFNDEFGVDSVVIEDGGSGYVASSPPTLIVSDCGQPIRDARLKPVIDDSGKIVAVEVIDPGEGYDPLRITLTPSVPEGAEQPVPAKGEVVLKDDGTVDYVKVLQPGDKHFYDVSGVIEGGVGTGATAAVVSKTVTGLAILQEGIGYEEPPTLTIDGGGGTGAAGVADVDLEGIVDGFTISDAGQFYLTAPYVLLVGGGGLGAKARAEIDQGQLSRIIVENPGKGYTSAPKVVFARNVKLKKISRNRQSFNSEFYNIAGITKNVARDDTSVFVSSTAPYPGSGVFLLQKELIRYTGKNANALTGCTRGINFRYDQRVVVDDLQVDENGVSTYEFNIGDRVIRAIESASSKIAVVYDWKPETRELFVVFQVDELAFIDAGSPSEKTNIVFDAGLADSSNSIEFPHTIVDREGDILFKLTNPPSFEADRGFEDDDELDGAGDGLPDLINTGTSFENQINLDGGKASTLYGIEETVGGQNTTLFQIGDTIKDSSLPAKSSTIFDASQLSEGVDHAATLTIKMDDRNSSNYNSINYIVGETVTGTNSSIQATVLAWNADTRVLQVGAVVPYDTGDPLIGELYEFSDKGTIVDIRVQEIGNNYASAPTVNIGTTGTIAGSATAVLLADQVNSITVNNGGYGYPSPPTITFSGGGGSGAVAEAILGGEKLTGGTSGASWRIQSISYDVEIRDDVF